MDSFSKAFAFTMHHDVADIDEVDRSTVPVPKPSAALLRVETLLDGLDPVKAVYEPAGH